MFFLRFFFSCFNYCVLLSLETKLGSSSLAICRLFIFKKTDFPCNPFLSFAPLLFSFFFSVLHGGASVNCLSSFSQSLFRFLALELK